MLVLSSAQLWAASRPLPTPALLPFEVPSSSSGLLQQLERIMTSSPLFSRTVLRHSITRQSSFDSQASYMRFPVTRLLEHRRSMTTFMTTSRQETNFVKRQASATRLRYSASPPSKVLDLKKIKTRKK